MLKLLLLLDYLKLCELSTIISLDLNQNGPKFWETDISPSFSFRAHIVIGREPSSPGGMYVIFSWLSLARPRALRISAHWPRCVLRRQVHATNKRSHFPVQTNNRTRNLGKASVQTSNKVGMKVGNQPTNHSIQAKSNDHERRFSSALHSSSFSTHLNDALAIFFLVISFTRNLKFLST